MHKFQPTETLRGINSRAGVLVKSIADVVPRTVRLSAEDDVGCGAHNGVEFLVFTSEFAIKLLQCLRSPFQFIGSLGDARLQFAIEAFQLVRLAVQFRKYADLRSQKF